MLINPSARENVLLLGLVDWVPLERVHYEVSRANRDVPLPEVQTRTLQLIDTLANEGLFTLGEVDASLGFIPWDTPLDASMLRLRQVYVDGFDDENFWQWFCWLDLTDRGEQVALPLEEQLNSPSES